MLLFWFMAVCNTGKPVHFISYFFLFCQEKKQKHKKTGYIYLYVTLDVVQSNVFSSIFFTKSLNFDVFLSVGQEITKQFWSEKKWIPVFLWERRGRKGEWCEIARDNKMLPTSFLSLSRVILQGKFLIEMPLKNFVWSKCKCQFYYRKLALTHSDQCIVVNCWLRNIIISFKNQWRNYTIYTLLFQ